MVDNIAQNQPQPDTPSSDYNAMNDYWSMVETILGGAKTMRATGQKYLPKFLNETEEDYKFRCANAKFTNVFRDIVENLAVKPFGEEVGLSDGASASIKNLIEDIDGKGNNLHAFAATTFFNGIAYALDWILVDYTKGIPPGASVAVERAMGARPYWVHVPARSVLAAYSDVVKGQEVLTHVRILEPVTERNGYGEVTRNHVRVFNREPILDGNNEVAEYAPATWEVFDRQQDPNTGKVIWVSIEQGVVTIGIIPMVPFITGRRLGSSWQFVPAMQDAADLQIELYQQESGLKNAKENTAFPMLAGNGVEPETTAEGGAKPIKVGPKSVLYAPPRQQGTLGRWEWLEPAASSLQFLAADIKETINQLRELGRQPLTAQTGNLTVVTTAFAAQKGNTAIQAWALLLKDALEQAFVITAKWLNEDKSAEVIVDTDFDVGLDDDKGPDTLVQMRKNGDLSRETLWHEMRRRSILSPDFDAEAEDKKLMDEMPGSVDPASDPNVEPLNAPPTENL